MTASEEEWNKVFGNILPAVSVAVGTLSVALGVIALTRAGNLARRAYYQDGQYLVSVRYGAWHDLREFITPDDPAVLKVYHQVGQDAWQMFDFVCRGISYRSDTGEFWQLARETLARKRGDCEDSSILLTSLLRNFTDAKVVLGDYYGYGHAWCQYHGQIYETTYTYARPVPDPGNYRAYALFHDQEIIELWPGALEELFSIRRDEVTKLSIMAGVLGNVG